MRNGKLYIKYLLDSEQIFLKEIVLEQNRTMPGTWMNYKYSQATD